MRIMCLLGNNEEIMWKIKISRKIECPLSHCQKVLRVLEDGGFIEIEIAGRKKCVTLTEKGKEIAKNLMVIKKIIKCQKN